MSRYYRLKTARPLPETFIPARVTQLQPFFACKILPNRTVLPRPDETTIVELDLEDPVVALQLLLRYREVFADGSDFVRQLDILFSLIATDEAGKARRRMFLYNLLLELDVPASPAKES